MSEPIVAPPPPSPPVNPAAAVSGPAIGLMVTAGLGALVQLGSLGMHMLGMGASAMPGGGGPEEKWVAMLSGGFGIAMSVIGLLMAGFVFFGASKMKALQSYGLVMGATIVAMVPCISPCCLLGLPIGIWALVILLKPEVKAAFRG